MMMDDFDERDLKNVELLDRVVVLENDIRLLTKVSDKYFSNGLLVLIHPYLITYNQQSTSLYLSEWIPEAATPVYFVPLAKIVTVTLPSSPVLEYYMELLNGNTEPKNVDVPNKSNLH